MKTKTVLGCAICAALLFLSAVAFSQDARSPQKPISTTPSTAEQNAAQKPSLTIQVQTPGKSEAEQEDEKREKVEKAKLDRQLVDLTAQLSLYTEVLAVATVVLVGATIALAFFAWFDFNEGRKSSEHQLRAYLMAEKYFMVAFGPNDILQAKFQIRNVGVTPAHNVRSHGGVAVVGFPPAPDMEVPPFPNSLTPPSTIFPGSAPLHGTLASSFRISDAEITRIRKQEACILVFGEILYFDEFRKKERVSRFCVFILENENNLIKLTSNYEPDDLAISFATAPVGNEST